MRIAFIFCVIFCYSVSCALGAQDPKPLRIIELPSTNVSDYIPNITKHSYDLLTTSNSPEPYLPLVEIPYQPFPQEGSFNIVISGLTKSFDGFSEVILGEKGSLEIAYSLYLQEKYEAAEQKLISLLPAEGMLGEKTVLLLAWTKFKKGLFESALIHAKAGFKATQESVQKESRYLAFLILYQQRFWDRLVSLYEEYSQLDDATQWDARICLMQLYALSYLERWKTAENFIDQIAIQRFAHSTLYYKFYELKGTVTFKRKQYKNSLEDFQKAHSLNPELSYQKRLNRLIVWLHYLSGSFESALDLSDRLTRQALLESNDEILYLRLACMIHLNRWQSVSQSFDSISPDSLFFGFAAFKIQMRSSQADLNDHLKVKLSKVQYHFPNLVFQTELKKGNSDFVAGKFSTASQYYMSAIAADPSNTDVYLAQFNLGLSYLNLHEYSKADRIFTSLSQTIPNQNLDLLTYHLLFTKYHLQKTKEFFDFYDSVNLTNLNEAQRYELQFMLGNILILEGRYEEAKVLFFQLWKIYAQLGSFESAIAIMYKQGKHTDLLQALKDNQELQSELLLSFEIRALLETNQESLALKKIEKALYSSDHFFELQIDVWFANQLYQKAIREITNYMNRSHSLKNRFRLYLSLGEAYFYLKLYGESKNQYYKALGLTKDAMEKSIIQYNISLAAYLLKDFPSFTQETTLALSTQQLNPSIRYQLTLLMVEHYQNSKQTNAADTVLAAYIDQHSFQRPQAKLKRMELLYQNQEYLRCFELSSLFDSEENLIQHRDRIALMGYCGTSAQKETTVIPLLEKELESNDSPHRKPELLYLLALAYFNQDSYQKSSDYLGQLKLNELEARLQFNARILIVKNLLKQNRLTEARQTLGEVNDYRQSSVYGIALNLLAELEVAQNNVDSAIKAILRVYYSPSATETEKQVSLLRIGEILASHQRSSEALHYMTKIDKAWIQTQEPLFQRFLELKRLLETPTQ